MTTGNKTLSRYFTANFPSYGNMTFGREVVKVWSGGDAVTTTKKRKDLPDRKQWKPHPPKAKPVYKVVYAGGRYRYVRVKQPKTLRTAKKPRIERPRAVIYNPIRKRWESRYVDEHEGLKKTWFEKIRTSKSLPPQPYTMTKTITERSVWKTREGSLMNVVPIGNTPWPTLVYDVSQEYRLIDKLRRQVYGSGFNPGIFLGEAPKALAMIGTAAIRLGAAIHSFRKGDWRGLFDAFGVRPNRTHEMLLSEDTKHGLKGWRGYNGQSTSDARRKVSKLWLETSYGWLPHVSDLEAGAAWLAYAIDPPLNAGGAVRGRRKWMESHWYNASNLNNLNYRKRDVTYKLQLIIQAVRKTPSVGLPSLPTVAATLWELTPYSFVSDWAVPIGSYLQALRTASDLKGTVIRTLTTEKKYSDLSPGGTGLNTYHPILRMAGVDDFTEVVTVARTITSEIVVPSPFSALTDGHDVITANWRRATNAVALLTKGNYSQLWEDWRNRKFHDPRADVPTQYQNFLSRSRKR